MTNEVCSHVRVVVRVRPTNDNERCENLRNVVQVVDNHMLIFDPREQGIQSFGAQHVQRRDVNKRSVKDLKFVFDAVFGEHSTQVDIFENTTKLVLDGVLNGFNCTVFAYGATGAGKTHTMLGSQNDPGVMYRTMKELFARMEEVKEDKVFEVAFSYLEVYNEQIRDLLANVGPLAVREDSSKGVVVQGLTLHQPKSAEHILEALDFGNKNRTQHPTDMNATSSRSHAVFQIYLRQQDKTASLNPNVRVAKLSLIDLAGSERASATNTKGARFREGANINRSLLALGNVINALANPRSKKAHIPYRDSKLTRLLKDSLGGNCRTVMIANISPSSKSYDDTHNTLKYANRAKEIKSSLKSNVVSLDSHISQYAVICEKQRQEILQLKKKLQEYEEIKMETQMPQATNDKSSHKQVEIEKVSKSLQSVFFSRTQIRREQLMLQRQLKENELRQQHSEESNQQAQLFCARDKTEKATCKHERKLASLFTQQKHICQRLEESGRRFQENESWLHRVENEIKMQGQEAQVPQVLQTELQCHRLQLQVEDLKQHIEQMTYLINLLDNEHQHTKKMVTILLPAYSRHYSTLRAAGQVTPADEAQNQELEHLVLRERAVVWADQEQAGQHLRQEGAEHKSASHTAGSSRLRPELAPTLSFSHLLYHQDSPCSAEKQTRRVSLRLQATLSSKVEPGGVMQEPFFKKPTRRKLSVSSPQSQESSSSCAQPQGHVVFREVLRQEGMFPLMYTPESVQRSVSVLPQLTSVSAKDSNTTFEVLDCDSETQANSTIIIHNGSPNQTANSSSSPLLQNLPLFQPPKVNCGSQQPTKRLKIPTLLDVTRAKTATYMAMTSAAQGKRRFNCIGEDHTVGFSAPKRIKQDLSMVSKPLRVRRPAGSGENESRRVIRSVSEGNLNLMEAQKSKSKSIFYKTSQQIKRVAKRM